MQMSTTMTSSSRPVIAAVPVYAAAMLLGATLVTVPASSAIIIASLKLDAARYGGVFIAQLVGALVCGVGLALLGSRVSLRAMLLLAIACLAGAQALLAVTQFADTQAAYFILMLVMLLVGGGIGIGGGPLNAYPALIFPRLANSAVTAVHVVAGIGMMLSPLYHALSQSLGHWVTGLIGLAAFGLVTLTGAAMVRLPVDAAAAGTGPTTTASPARDRATWLLVAAAIVYSVAEGIFSNWAILYLEGKALDAATASLALTAFLGGITLGRLVASFLAVRIRPVMFLSILPILIALAFVWLPRVDTSVGAISAFGFAGLACSAYFPMLITYAARNYPVAIGWIATLMISAQMVGIGLGTFVVGSLVKVIPFEQLYHLAAVLPLATLLMLFLSTRRRK